MNAFEFVKRLERECSPPFMPKGFVRVVHNPPGDGFALVIGDRDIQFDNEGEFVGSGTGVGSGAKWEIRKA